MMLTGPKLLVNCSLSNILVIAAIAGAIIATCIQLVSNKSTNNTSILMVTSNCACVRSATSPAIDEREVLPANVRPEHYDLVITPNPVIFSKASPQAKDFTFSGQASIMYHNLSHSPSSSVALIVSIKSFAVDEKAEVLKIVLSQPIKAGSKGRLNIDYAGTINDKMAGFYRSSYKDNNGDVKFMASTQFEATDARRAFPCWDEPASKATFSISLQVPKEMTALGNMDVKAEAVDHQSKMKTVSFKKTPIMSTYLIAWAVGDLDDGQRVAKTRGGKEVRVWATRGTPADSGDFARAFAAKTLDFFTDYFGVEYPLPKMDMLAVPDFAAGAMENWGLVTYRTTYLLFDQKTSSLKAKQAVASVVGHELAHQWFGNLVTMEWWSDLWLNEGFASWVGELAVDHQHPEWKVWTEFVVNDCQAGLGLDSLRSSHPIEVPVKSPNEISQIFDSISYSKGASIIRMLVGWLGEDVFKKGIQAYLKKFIYGNARTDELWSSLSEASGKPVNEMMSGWTRHIGYPVLDVEFNAKGKLQVAQRRFLSSGCVAGSDEDQMIWTVPLFPDCQSSDAIVLDQRSSAFDQVKSTCCLKLNSGQSGFYRTNYPSDWLGRLGQAIQAGKLSDPVDRLGLLSDVHSLATSGDRDLTDFLDLAVKFEQEDNYFVWCELLNRLGSVLALVWEDDAQYEQVRTLINSLTAKITTKLGFEYQENDSDLVKLLRQRIIASAGANGNEQVIKEAKERFAKFIGGDESAIHPDLRGTVYSIAIREGGMKEYEQVLKLYNTLDIPDQKLAALGALGVSRQESVLKEALSLTTNTDIVRAQDVIYIFRSVGGNRHGRMLCWSFLKENWMMFHGRYQKGGFSLLSRIITSCTDGFTKEQDADMINAYFDSQGDTKAGISRALEQSLERIRTNAKCLERNADKLSGWFRDKLPALIKRAII